MRRQAKESAQRVYHETLETAERRGLEWTGPELELISDPRLTAREAGLIIRRTNRAVGAMRQKLKTDPRKINVAGIPDV